MFRRRNRDSCCVRTSDEDEQMANANERASERASDGEAERNEERTKRRDKRASERNVDEDGATTAAKGMTGSGTETKTESGVGTKRNRIGVAVEGG